MLALTIEVPVWLVVCLGVGIIAALALGWVRREYGGATVMDWPDLVSGFFSCGIVLVGLLVCACVYIAHLWGWL